ncbi:hypothetical protein PAMP_004090 [Pampus punctatissimus]
MLSYKTPLLHTPVSTAVSTNCFPGELYILYITGPKQSAYSYSKVIEKNGFLPKTQYLNIQGLKNTGSNRLSSIPPSTVPSQAKDVWRRFSSQSNFQRKIYHYGTFPQGFSWEASSSAYQIEGGWNADGKGLSVWDSFTNKSGSIPANANGNVACDSYHRHEEDLYMLRALRVKSIPKSGLQGDPPSQQDVCINARRVSVLYALTCLLLSSSDQRRVCSISETPESVGMGSLHEIKQEWKLEQEIEKRGPVVLWRLLCPLLFPLNMPVSYTHQMKQLAAASP